MNESDYASATNVTNDTIFQQSEMTYDNTGNIILSSIAERMTTLASGVDGTVKRISMTYNIVGQIEKITSHDKATIGSGNVINEVKYEYDTNGLLAKEYQNPSGSVTASSLYTGYTYDTTKSGDYFTRRLRPTTLRYPSNTVVNYVYGISNSVDDKLNPVYCCEKRKHNCCRIC